MFRRSLAYGKKHEATLDTFFGRNWTITPLTLNQERAGLGDRQFCRDGDKYLIEYKSDETASRTGNAFIETVSVDTTDKPGWAITCKADFIFYYLPLDNLIYVISPETIRANLKLWQNKYQTVPTGKGKNDGYRTWGIKLPLYELEQAASKVISV